MNVIKMKKAEALIKVFETQLERLMIGKDETEWYILAHARVEFSHGNYDQVFRDIERIESYLGVK